MIPPAGPRNSSRLVWSIALNISSSINATMKTIMTISASKFADERSGISALAPISIYSACAKAKPARTDRGR